MPRPAAKSSAGVVCLERTRLEPSTCTTHSPRPLIACTNPSAMLASICRLRLGLPAATIGRTRLHEPVRGNAPARERPRRCRVGGSFHTGGRVDRAQFGGEPGSARAATQPEERLRRRAGARRGATRVSSRKEEARDRGPILGNRPRLSPWAYPSHDLPNGRSRRHNHRHHPSTTPLAGSSRQDSHPATKIEKARRRLEWLVRKGDLRRQDDPDGTARYSDALRLA
jgi:hypothetical protein